MGRCYPVGIHKGRGEMSKTMKEDRSRWAVLALALGLLRELEERENQYINREVQDETRD